MSISQVLEKMFLKFNILVDGQEVYNSIISSINSNGYPNGYHNIEIGRLGRDNKICFCGINLINDYDEEEDVFTFDVNISDISVDGEVLYVSELELV